MLNENAKSMDNLHTCSLCEVLNSFCSEFYKEERKEVLNFSFNSMLQKASWIKVPRMKSERVKMFNFFLDETEKSGIEIKSFSLHHGIDNFEVARFERKPIEWIGIIESLED